MELGKLARVWRLSHPGRTSLTFREHGRTLREMLRAFAAILAVTLALLLCACASRPPSVEPAPRPLEPLAAAPAPVLVTSTSARAAVDHSAARVPVTAADPQWGDA